MTHTFSDNIPNHWRTGALAYRRTGALAHWRTGALAYWRTGIRRRCLVLVLLYLVVPCGARATTVLLIGDSIFWGMGAGGGRYRVSFQLQRELKDAFVFDYSAPGATMAWFFSPSPGCVEFYGGINKKLDVAVIGLGLNDWVLGVPLEYFSAKYEQFLQGIQTTIPNIACVPPLWTSREGRLNKVGATIADYRAAISKICTQRNLKRYFWNGLEAVPADRRFFLDDLHPNRAGHRRYAKWLRDQLVRDGLVKESRPPSPARKLPTRKPKPSPTKR